MKNVLVTGANGFIGKQLVESLSLRKDINLSVFNRGDDLNKIIDKDYIFHLAGVINPKNESEYETSNVNLTKNICDRLESVNQTPSIIFSSSYRVEDNTPYGISKRKSEIIIENWAIKNKGNGIIYRLVAVFGKNCKPNHTSVIATFCYNVSHDLPLRVSDRFKVLEFVYIDNVITSLIKILDETVKSKMYRKSYPIYKISLGDLANTIQSFKKIKNSNFQERFNELLYEIYISYINYTIL